MKAPKQAQALSRARSDLAAYAVAMYRRFEMPSHLRVLVEVLEQVERGELDRVIITMPPRHGKSLLASTLFPAWWLGRNPEQSIIASSYGGELATDFGRRGRNFVSEKLHRAIFPESELSSDSQAISRFSTSRGGAYYAVGAGGAITGRGADLLLIDDPIKGREEADSATFRKSLQGWYESVAYPRLEPNGAIVLIQTRWNVDDLAGCLLTEHFRENWRVVNFPALAEKDDLLGRIEGHPLWPERYPLTTLWRTRRAIGSAAWLSLYQQRPVALEGNIIHKDWLKSYGGPIDATRTIFSLDTAYKTGKENDYSAIVIISEAKTGYHLRLMSKGRWEFSELKRQTGALAEIWRPSAVLIEDAASGQSLIQSLKSETRLPILPVKPQGDKISRVNAVAPLFESGRVCVPESAPWLADFLEELISFPSGAHDDCVDALALNWMRGTAWASSEDWQALSAQMKAHEVRKRHPSSGYSGSMTLTAEEMTRREDGISSRINGVSYTNRTRFSGRRGAW